MPVETILHSGIVCICRQFFVIMHRQMTLSSERRSTWMVVGSVGLILKEIFRFTHSGVKPSIKFFVEREICKSPSRGFIYPLVSICFYHFTNLQFCHGLCNTLYFFVYSPLGKVRKLSGSSLFITRVTPAGVWIWWLCGVVSSRGISWVPESVCCHYRSKCSVILILCCWQNIEVERFMILQEKR